ncbi:toll/interleukin-1 receptor domain-containing protein [Bradyrhizobium ottawaense]|uniref:toll/interleukin-1 receptor domain-containing protein n=2 Tax=Bradyrhizobium ottawaense TaxID=931866 RepID=UPI0030C6A777
MRHSPQRKPSRVSQKEERRVWLYMVDGRNNADLAKLDAEGFDTWRGHSNTRMGDLVLMYRTAPYSDFAYLFTAISDTRPTYRTQRWPWKTAVDLGGGFRLRRTIKLIDLKNDRRLAGWSFLINQRGATSRRQDLQDQGVWRGLRKIIEIRDPDSKRYIDHWRSRQRPSVFLSYASPDKQKIMGLYEALRRNGIEVWLDQNELIVGDKYNEIIRNEIASCRAFVTCLSGHWLERAYAQKELDWALDRTRGQNGFLFPVKLENCMVPKRLTEEVQIAKLYGRGKEVELEKFAHRLRSILVPA